MSSIKDGNFISVQAFMVKDLHLKGNELLVYALIYGFSQTDGQVFKGSLQYISDWTNCTKQGILKVLKSLLEKNLIEKKTKIENGVKFCEYYATEFNRVLNKVDHPIKQSLTPPIKQSLPNNIDNNNIEDNINNNIRAKRFCQPTLEEVSAYCKERNNSVDAERFIDYYSSNGWMVGKSKMKDWKAAVRNWERNDKKAKLENNHATTTKNDFDGELF